MANSKYTEDFKKKVALAASDGSSTLKAVGQNFAVNPTLVRNWMETQVQRRREHE